ncbi:MAG: hypothetical protein QOD84_1048 [Acidobacteriaceae bacterium]|jgi:hypothetical protein|nr:hypothetical protein [Acidobacteriaceae bacterium]
MNSTELLADPELNDGMFGKPQAEQDWLRAEQEEQQWLQAEQDALSQDTNVPSYPYTAALLHQTPQLRLTKKSKI